MTGAQALAAAVRRLTEAGIEGAPRDARRLLAHALGVGPDRVTLILPDEMPPEAEARLAAAVAARAARQPIAQITGRRAFFGRTFRVTPDTLDPRPETELLVEAALEQPFVRVLDLGTGTGCILLSCLAAMPMASGIGTDISAPALAVARENAERLGLAGRARFLASDWFAGVTGRFDLIISNPPYIAEAELAGLAPEVRDWEPRQALTPGGDGRGDGLGAYRAIVAGVGARLIAGGRLILEIGPTQAEAVSALLTAQGFQAPEVRRDLDGRDRMILAMKPAARAPSA